MRGAGRGKAVNRVTAGSQQSSVAVLAVKGEGTQRLACSQPFVRSRILDLRSLWVAFPRPFPGTSSPAPLPTAGTPARPPRACCTTWLGAAPGRGACWWRRGRCRRWSACWRQTGGGTQEAQRGRAAGVRGTKCLVQRGMTVRSRALAADRWGNGGMAVAGVGRKGPKEGIWGMS